MSANYSDWIDLFGWATSGWNSGAVAYMPYSTSTDYLDYVIGGSYPDPDPDDVSGGVWDAPDLTGSTAEADWAWHNAISNGGNKTHMWRTLTYEEWRYIIYDRPDASIKNGPATVANIHGCIILPDVFTLPPGVTFTPKVSNWNTNVYSASDWKKMEDAGAIFLPAAGSRRGKSVYGINESGHYWTSTHRSRLNSYAAFVHNSGISCGGAGSRDFEWGTSVRPVKNV